MIIPEGQNYFKFYEAAKAQGVKITSRFIGVCIDCSRGSVRWLASYVSDTGIKRKHFPFTAIGEMQADRWCKEGVKKRAIPRKRKLEQVKRKYKHIK
jgi:hypothetical protein